MRPRLSALLCLTFLLAACAKPQEITMRDLVRNGDFTLRLSLDPAPDAGRETALTFAVDRDGAPVDMEEEGLMLHVMLASPDYRDFLHTYTVETVAPGRYRVAHPFTKRGLYRVWAEVDDAGADDRHGENALLISTTDVVVGGGEESVGQEPQRSATFESGNGVTVRLESPPSPLVAGTEGTLRLTAEDAAGRMTFPEGEAALYVIVGPEQTLVWHGHAADHDGRTISLRHAFPLPGEYLLWMQLFPKNAAGEYRVTESRFLFQVETGTEE